MNVSESQGGGDSQMSLQGPILEGGNDSQMSFKSTKSANAIPIQGNSDSQASLNVPAPSVLGNPTRERAIKNAIKFNSELNQIRREERRVSMDMQTFTVHYPVGHGKDNKILQKNVATGRYRKVGKYPIATIHGQFQDWYIDYSPDELKYFPINTVLYGPITPNKIAKPPQPTEATANGQAENDESGSGSESDSDSDSCCSAERLVSVKKENGEEDSDGSDDEMSCDSYSSSGSSDVENHSSRPSKHKSQMDICKLCKGTSKVNRQNLPEELLKCAECSRRIHPSCLQLTTDMVEIIKSYKWQCTDCKKCVLCDKPHSEAELLFCDLCDRGYHTFCVNLRVIPSGKWVCQLCGPSCAECGKTSPGEGTKVNWYHESIKILSPSGETLRRQQLLCLLCYKQRKSRSTKNKIDV